MDDNITISNPGDGDLVIDAPQIDGAEGEGWTVPDDDVPAAEVQEQAKQEEDETAASEDDESEAEEETPEEPEWDGRWESLPPEEQQKLAPKLKVMEQGLHQKFRELAAMRKEYEEKLEKQTAAPPPKSEESSAFPRIQEGESDDHYLQRVAEFTQKLADAAAQKAVSGLTPKLEAQEKELQAAQAQQRYLALTRRDGFTPEIETKMAELAQESDFWRDALQSDDGLSQLFDYAKTQVTTSQKRRATTKHKAGAIKRAVSRPRESAPTSKVSSPADNFASTLEQMGKEAAEELGLSWS